nr:TLC domain-containing protein 4-B-like [Lytechinus pictus]
MAAPETLHPPEIVLDLTYVPIVVYSFILCGIALCVSPYLSWWFVPTYRNISIYERFDWNSRILSMFHAILVSSLAVYSSLFDVPTFEDKIWGTSFIPRATIAVTTGYISADMILMFVGFPIKESIFYIFHHLAVVGAFTANVLYGPLTYFGNIRVIAEASTPFVNLRWMLYLLGYKDTKLYLYNGFVMLGVFFAVRVGILPIFYYYMLRSFFIEGFQRMQLWVTLTCLICSVGLDSINMYWFFKMARGAYRMLKKKSTAKDKTATNDTSDSHIKGQ